MQISVCYSNVGSDSYKAFCVLPIWPFTYPNILSLSCEIEKVYEARFVEEDEFFLDRKHLVSYGVTFFHDLNLELYDGNTDLQCNIFKFFLIW